MSKVEIVQFDDESYAVRKTTKYLFFFTRISYKSIYGPYWWADNECISRYCTTSSLDRAKEVYQEVRSKFVERVINDI